MLVEEYENDLLVKGTYYKKGKRGRLQDQVWQRNSEPLYQRWFFPQEGLI